MVHLSGLPWRKRRPRGPAGTFIQVSHDNWGRDERPFFFLRQLFLALNSFIYFLKHGELLEFARKQVDKTVFLNGSNCHWRSICSEENVHRASLLTGDFFFASLLVGVEFP